MMPARRITNTASLIIVSIALFLSSARADEAPMTQERLQDLILNMDGRRHFRKFDSVRN